MRQLVSIGRAALVFYALGCPENLPVQTNITDLPGADPFYTISGFVISRTSTDTTAVASAQVALDTHRVALTNASGYFAFDSVTRGYHSLSASADGHTAVQRMITLLSDTSWHVELTPYFTVSGVAFGVFHGDTIWADSATIMVDRRWETTADSFGKFTFPSIDAGEHTLEILHQSFATPSHSVTVDSTRSLVFDLPVVSGMSDMFPLARGETWKFDYSYAYTEPPVGGSMSRRFEGFLTWQLATVEIIAGARVATMGKHVQGRIIYGYMPSLSDPITYDTLYVDQAAGEFIIRQTPHHELLVSVIESPADTLPVNMQGVMDVFPVRRYEVIPPSIDTLKFLQELSYNDAQLHLVPGMGPTYVYRLHGNHTRVIYEARRME